MRRAALALLLLFASACGIKALPRPPRPAGAPAAPPAAEPEKKNP